MVRWKVPGISVTPPKSNEWIPKMMGRLENVSKRLQTWRHFGYRHVRFQGCSFVLMESHKFLFSLLNCFHHPAACFTPRTATAEVDLGDEDMLPGGPKAQISTEAANGTEPFCGEKTHAGTL